MPDSTNRPPLAKAVREFMTGIQWPPLPKKCRHNHLKDHSHLVLAMLLHARNVQEKAESITCSPSLLQIAQLMFCSTRTVQRAIEAFPPGFLSVKKRPRHLSNEFTIYQKYQPHLDTTQCVHSKSNSRHDTSESRHDTKAVQTRHQAIETRHRVSTSGVDLQELCSSGVVLQGDSAEAKPTPTTLFPNLKSQGQSQKPEPTPEPTWEEKKAQVLERLLAHARANGMESDIPELEVRLARSRAAVQKQREEARSIADRVLGSVQ